MNKFGKEIFPTEDKFVLYNSVTLPIIAIVIKTEVEQNKYKPEGSIVKTITETEEANIPHHLYAWQDERQYRPSRRA